MAVSSNPEVPKLTEACIQSLIEVPTDPKKLYDLSVDELVELNTRLLAERQADREELTKLKRNRYYVDPPEVQERVGDDMYERVRNVTQAWQPVSPSAVGSHEMDSISNIGKDDLHLKWDPDTGKASYEVHRGYGLDLERSLAYASVISSPLLLYRLCCLFECDIQVEGPQGYKVVWSTYLKHQASGHFVGFSEWKGSALYRTSQFPPTGTAFDDDWLALLNLLLDPQCPHPYDGTVAGSVA